MLAEASASDRDGNYVQCLESRSLGLGIPGVFVVVTGGEHNVVSTKLRVKRDSALRELSRPRLTLRG